MLKLTVKAGEYLLVGDNIKLVFTGGSASNLHILVDAPKSMNVVRSAALEKYGMAPGPGNEVKHHKDRELSQDCWLITHREYPSLRMAITHREHPKPKIGNNAEVT